MYRVIFYIIPGGRSPIEDFIISSNSSLRSKIARQINYLREFGLTSANPSVRKLTGTPLWEVRVLGKDNTRIICVAVINKTIYILNIFRKKSNKTPSREINLAIKRYKTLDK